MKKSINIRGGWRVIGGITGVTVLVAGSLMARPQLAALKGGTSAPAPPAQVEPEKDPLGRTTPKGTVLGFLSASHKKSFELAEEYLDPRFRGKGAEDLIQQF